MHRIFNHIINNHRPYIRVVLSSRTRSKWEILNLCINNCVLFREFSPYSFKSAWRIAHKIFICHYMIYVKKSKDQTTVGTVFRQEYIHVLLNYTSYSTILMFESLTEMHSMSEELQRMTIIQIKLTKQENPYLFLHTVFYHVWLWLESIKWLVGVAIAGFSHYLLYIDKQERAIFQSLHIKVGKSLLLAHTHTVV